MRKRATTTDFFEAGAVGFAGYSEKHIRRLWRRFSNQPRNRRIVASHFLRQLVPTDIRLDILRRYPTDPYLWKWLDSDLPPDIYVRALNHPAENVRAIVVRKHLHHIPVEALYARLRVEPCDSIAQDLMAYLETLDVLDVMKED